MSILEIVKWKAKPNVSDKNSWALGGAIALSQTVEAFMEGASKKIEKELEKSKLPKKIDHK